MFKSQAVLCTDPGRILSWFVRRWRMEVTFQEVRRHLGFETQRQWSEMAIQRTVPALLGLFSLNTLFAEAYKGHLLAGVRRASCRTKQLSTFADALTLVRKELWAQETFCGPLSEADLVRVPRLLIKYLTDAVCYAAEWLKSSRGGFPGNSVGPGFYS